MVKVVLTEEVTFEHRLEGGDRVSYVAIWGKCSKQKDQEHTDRSMPYVQGTVSDHCGWS